MVNSSFGQQDREQYPPIICREKLTAERRTFAGAAKMLDASYAEHLAVFVDAARAGSFSAAARGRAATPSSVARKIDALEQALQVKLFVRSTRSLRLTEAGLVLLERSRPLLDGLADLKAEVASVDGSLSGVLRVATLPTFGRRYVAPAIEHVARQHPGFTVELDLTERLADPMPDRVDAVIRIGELPDSSLIRTRLAWQRMTLCASPDYLARAGAPRSPAELLQHRLLDKLTGDDLLGWRHVLGGPTWNVASRQVALRCNDFEVLRDAACRGLGVARLATWVTWADVAAGRLIPVLSGLVAETPQNIWLLRALPRPSAKYRAFLDALTTQIGSPPIWEAAPAGPLPLKRGQ